MYQPFTQPWVPYILAVKNRECSHSPACQCVMTCGTGSCSWVCRTWGFCVCLLYFFLRKWCCLFFSQLVLKPAKRQEEASTVVSLRSTILKSKILCNVLLFWCIMSQEITNGKDWGVFMSVRLLSASVSHCFHLDYLDCSLSCWHWRVSCINAILSCSLRTGKVLT